MDQSLEDLNNKLSRKRIDYFEIIKSCDDNGEIHQKFYEKQIYDPRFDFYCSLVSAELVSMFPNISASLKNNKFYYSCTDANNRTEDKVITFDTGAYGIADINSFIHDHLRESEKESVKIELDVGNGKTKIFLKPGYKVDFTKEETFRDILGFNSVICSSLRNISPKMADVIVSGKIFIELDIIRGALYNGAPSQIFYSLSNNVAYGGVIHLKPKFREEHLLTKKSFDSIRIRFKDQDNHPITFEKIPVALKIEIRQV